MLAESKTSSPYVLVADDAFSLTSYLMKPYAGELTNGSPQKVFTYRIPRAHHIVENAFGLLASVFQIFRKPLNVKPSTAKDITLTCAYLHDFLRTNFAMKQLHSLPGTLDFENTDRKGMVERNLE